MSRVSAWHDSPAWRSAVSSSSSEVEKRGLAASIAVVEMPATRTGPGRRTTLRSSGWGSWGMRCRLVAASRFTNTWQRAVRRRGAARPPPLVRGGGGGLVGDAVPLRGGLEVHEHVAALDLHLVAGDRLVLLARLPPAPPAGGHSGVA